MPLISFRPAMWIAEVDGVPAGLLQNDVHSDSPDTERVNKWRGHRPIRSREPFGGVPSNA